MRSKCQVSPIKSSPGGIELFITFSSFTVVFHNLWATDNLVHPLILMPPN